jgi:hypothetical protein
VGFALSIDLLRLWKACLQKKIARECFGIIECRRRRYRLGVRTEDSQSAEYPLFMSLFNTLRLTPLVDIGRYLTPVVIL